MHSLDEKDAVKNDSSDKAHKTEDKNCRKTKSSRKSTYDRMSEQFPKIVNVISKQCRKGEIKRQILKYIKKPKNVNIKRCRKMKSTTRRKMQLSFLSFFLSLSSGICKDFVAL